MPKILDLEFTFLWQGHPVAYRAPDQFKLHTLSPLLIVLTLIFQDCATTQKQQHQRIEN